MILCKRFFAIFLFLTPVSLHAQLIEQPQSDALIDGSGVPAAIETSIYERLQSARPDLAFTDLERSPVEGLYKIKINGQVSFVSASGEFLIAGEMYHLQGNNLVNLQERDRQIAAEAFEPQRAELMNAVSKDDMVIYSPKEVKTYVNVFTDIDCGFCRKLHSQMDEFLEKGIEIRYLAFPRAGVSSRSAQKLATVWCSGPEGAPELMTRFKQGQDVALKPCDNNPIADQYMLGQELGVTGTPSIILPSGRIIPGAVSAEYLAQALGI